MINKSQEDIYYNGMFILLITIQLSTSSAYTQLIPKDTYINNIIVSEILNRMEKNILHSETYSHPLSDVIKNLDLIPRTYKMNGNKDNYYESLYAATSNPSIRDQEYLQHSSLWGHQFKSEGMVEGSNQIKQVVRTDVSLPAYCNPPNPCPYGYNSVQGCTIDFDNTAVFSREFQASQECMCDNEHMFDCPGQNNNQNKMNTDIGNFLEQQFKIPNEVANKNFVAKKIYMMPKNINPFLKGQQLPTAAKKGKHIN